MARWIPDCGCILDFDGNAIMDDAPLAAARACKHHAALPYNHLKTMLFAESRFRETVRSILAKSLGPKFADIGSAGEIIPRDEIVLVYNVERNLEVHLLGADATDKALADEVLKSAPIDMAKIASIE